MTYGVSVFNSSGTQIWSTDGILARVIGVATITFAASEYTTKTATISGMVSTDFVTVVCSDNQAVTFTVTTGTNTVSIQRTYSYFNQASTHYIWVFRGV